MVPLGYSRGQAAALHSDQLELGTELGSGSQNYSVILLTTIRTLITGSMPHYSPFGLLTERLERHE